MKVCQVGTGCSPISEKTSTATEAVVYNLSKELSKIVDVHIVDLEDKERKKLLNVRYHEIAMPRFFGPRVYTTPKTIKHIARRVFYAVKTTLKFMPLMKRENFDVIHAHNQYTGFCLSLMNRLFWKKNFVYTLHTPFWVLPKNELSSLFCLQTILERICFRNCTKVITVSDALKNAIQEKTNVDPRKIAALPNGVDLLRFHPGHSSVRSKLSSHNEKIILCVARISRIKNQMLIINAIPEIIKRGQKVKFVFIGQVDDAGYFKEILESIKKNKIGGYIKFFDAIENVRLPEYYRAADIFILPSSAEGMPLVLLEAMASGCAIISSDIPSNKEVSKDKEIIYFSLKNKDELKSKILEILKNKNKMKILKRKARKSAERFFGWGSIAKKTLELYKSL